MFSVLLSSCNSITDTTTQATVTTEAPILTTTTITEEMTLTTETEITEETIETTIRTQENINAAWEARLQNNTDVDLSAVRITDGKIQVTDEYPELKTAVDAIVEEHESIASSFDRDMGNYMITRFDGKCLCFVYEGFVESAFSWSYKTHNLRFDGSEIELDEIITDIDSYCKYGAEIIDAYDNNNVFYFHRDPRDAYTVMQDIKDYEWVMTESSILFYIVDEQLTGVPYRQTADLLNPEFLPGDGDCYGISNYGMIEFGDNVFMSDDEYVPGSETALFPLINSTSINYVNELSERGYECGYYGYCYPQYLCIDGDSYVYFYAHGMYEGVHFSALYDITPGEPIFVYGSDSESAIDDALDIVSLIS